MAPVTPPAGGALWTVTTSAGLAVVDGRPDERHGQRGERPGPQAVGVHDVGPPGPEQAAQPRDRPQVAGQPRPRPMSTAVNPTPPGAAPAKAKSRSACGGAEHLGPHAAGRAPGREHPDVPPGAAGAGAEDEGDLHALTRGGPGRAAQHPDPAAQDRSQVSPVDHGHDGQEGREHDHAGQQRDAHVGQEAAHREAHGHAEPGGRPGQRAGQPGGRGPAEAAQRAGPAVPADEQEQGQAGAGEPDGGGRPEPGHDLRPAARRARSAGPPR